MTTTAYTYDNNGNQLTKSVSAMAPAGETDAVGILPVGGGVLDAASPYAFELYQYDVLNRLVKSDTMAGTAEYAYNAVGLRVSKTINGVATKYVWDGGQIAAELSGSVTARYTRGIGLIKSDTSWYLFNAHGDVVQLTNSSGTVTRDYDYDAFGVEGSPDSADTNSFRYSGEYYDKETGSIYLRVRYYNPRTGRFNAEDAHWNTGNMIYGDDPTKWNEREPDDDDPLGLNTYTYTYTYIPQITAIMQSSNLYVYVMNNPIRYNDPEGDSAVDILAGAWSIGGGLALADGPIPVGDVAGVIVGIGGSIVAGGYWLWDTFFAKKSPSLPSWKKVNVNISHIISGHTPGGGRGDGGKDNFPPGMKETLILKAIEEAYKHAEKIGELQYSWSNGVELVKQQFQGPWGDRLIQFWYNYTTKTIETAWPK